MLQTAMAKRLIEIRQIKYLNTIIEQDHRFIKRSTRPMMGFKGVPDICGLAA